jgi:hypothetical protein
MKYIIGIALSLIISFSFAKGSLSDDQIKKQMIQQSIASYSGSCPCPYNATRNGSSCGARSAYSKPGGYDPLCYPKDITPSMLNDYKKRNGL